MLLAVLILLAVLVAVSCVALAVILAPVLTAPRRRRVVVNLRSGESLTGTVVRQWGGRVELVDARLHEAGEVRPLDGRALAYKGNVTFLQVLPAIDPDGTRAP